jgi:uncharacterized protein YceH (UPF0502 family)
MKETVYTNQKLNTELLLRGAATHGSFERRLARLQRFMAYEDKQMTSRQVLRKLILEEEERMSQRAKLRASEQSAAWALLELRNYKTETKESVELPTTNGDNDHCIREHGGTVYHVQIKPPLV